MNAGRAITNAMRAQRAKDFFRFLYRSVHGDGVSVDGYYRLQAYLQWGWSITRDGRSLGRPGL